MTNLTLVGRPDLLEVGQWFFANSPLPGHFTSMTG